jgi:hypothetical protein
MNRRNFLKLCGCALLAPREILSKKPDPKATLDELVKYLVLQKQRAFTAYLMDGLLHSTKIIGVGLISGEMYISKVNPRNFWEGKPPPNKQIGTK